MSLQLDTIERKKIEKLRRAERDMRIWRRLSALLWSDEGETAEEVARRLGVTARQIRKWLKAYRTHGLEGLCELHYRGRVPRLDDAQVEELKGEIAKGQFRTAREIGDWINQRFKVQYSESGVKELLKRIGVSYHKVTGFMWKADVVEQEEWLDGYRCDPVGTGIRRDFVDACHPVWGFDMLFYCWLLVGQRFHVKVGSGRKRLNILGAYCPEDHEYLDRRYVKENLTARSVIALFERMMEVHPEVEVFVIYLDNAKYHHAVLVKQWVERVRCEKAVEFRLEYLPAYSPNLNLIERLWRFLRKEALQLWHETFESMESAVSDVLDPLERYRQELRSLMS